MKNKETSITCSSSIVGWKRWGNAKSCSFL